MNCVASGIKHFIIEKKQLTDDTFQLVFLKFKYQRTKQKSTIDLESTKLTEVGITDRQTCVGVIKHNICQMILKNH